MRTASPIGSQKGRLPPLGRPSGSSLRSLAADVLPSARCSLPFALYSFADNNLSICLLCFLSHNTRASTTVVTLPTSSILICSRLFLRWERYGGTLGALSRFGRAPPSSDRRAPHWP